MYKDLMIQASMWSSLFYSMSYPFIHLYIMRDRHITEKLVSVEQVVICVSIIIINSLWNKHSEKLYKWLKELLFIESLAYLVLMIGMSMHIFSPLIYFITDMLLFSLISRNIICGGNKLKSIRYKNEEREKYDNTLPIACAVATLIGSFIAFTIRVPVSVAFILAWIGITIDNIFYRIVYSKHNANEI